MRVFVKVYCHSFTFVNMRFIVNPVNICWSSRRLEDVFNTSYKYVFKTSSA